LSSTNGQYATAADDGDRLPPPSPQDQEVVLDAWRLVLGSVLHDRDCEWKEQLRAIKAESMAAVAELRVAAAEFRSRMEGMVAERLAQIRQPVDGKEGPRGEAGPRGSIKVPHLAGLPPTLVFVGRFSLAISLIVVLYALRCTPGGHAMSPARTGHTRLRT
jgi:hypothetical protein